MASTTVAQLAAELNRNAAALLEQLQSAGVIKASTSDSLSESDKERLLDYLRTSHGTVAGAERKKITLVRKSTSEIKQADSSGKARTIQVEVRKKRTFIKRDDVAPGTEEAVEPEIDEAELRRREAEVQAQADLLRRQEEDLAEKRRLREEQDERDRHRIERIRPPKRVAGQQKIDHRQEDHAKADRNEQPRGGEAQRLEGVGAVDADRDHRQLQRERKVDDRPEAGPERCDLHVDLARADHPSGFRRAEQQHEIE